MALSAGCSDVLAVLWNLLAGAAACGSVVFGNSEVLLGSTDWVACSTVGCVIGTASDA